MGFLPYDALQRAVFDVVEIYTYLFTIKMVVQFREVNKIHCVPKKHATTFSMIS